MKSVLSILLLLVATSGFGQFKFQSTDLSEVRKNKNQIELGLSSFSRIWNGTTSGTLLFKRSYTGGDLVEVNAIKLVRAFVTSDTQFNFTDDPSRNPGDTTAIVYHPSDITDVTFGIGLEKQKKGKRLVHYYGADLFAHLYSIDDDFRSSFGFGGVVVNGTNPIARLIKTNRFGINPFIGAKYYFNDQLSLGIETGFQVFYFLTQFTEVEAETRFVNNQFVEVYLEKEPVRSNGLGIFYNGVRFVTLGYAF